jgi:prepilin signal peptidase PulO-like enzyme (type II secretory pathway)
MLKTKKDMVFFGSLIFIFGICVGSFLNVLIVRLAAEEQVTRGRSHCVKCGHNLVWQDLVPILSFLWLKGKCRYCRKKISWQYPIVEIATGSLFVFLVLRVFPELVEGYKFAFDFVSLRSGSIFELFFYFFITSCLVVIFVSDLKYFIIPDEIIIAGCVGAFIYKFFEIWNFEIWNLFRNWKLEIGNWETLGIYLLSGLTAAAFFMSVVILTKGKGMGIGDVKLAFLMGLVLGWPQILAALLLAFSAGALFGLGLMLARRANMKTELPFGTFLAVATFAVMLFGSQFGGFLRIF